MIVPPVGALASELGLSGAGLSHGSATTGAQALPAGNAEGIAGGGVEPAAGGAGEGTFANALSGAISSLESTQKSADAASQSLATGTAKDPESAVVTVEDAQMTMDLAAQLRTKATEAVQSVFQTQV